MVISCVCLFKLHTLKVILLCQLQFNNLKIHQCAKNDKCKQFKSQNKFRMRVKQKDHCHLRVKVQVNHLPTIYQQIYLQMAIQCIYNASKISSDILSNKHSPESSGL